MRQGGMKPKSHSSGTYWVRTNAKNGNDANSKNDDIEDFGDAIDSLTSERTTNIATAVGRIIGLGLAGYLLYIGVTHPPNIFN